MLHVISMTTHDRYNLLPILDTSLYDLQLVGKGRSGDVFLATLKENPNEKTIIKLSNMKVVANIFRGLKANIRARDVLKGSRDTVVEYQKLFKCENKLGISMNIVSGKSLDVIIGEHKKNNTKITFDFALNISKRLVKLISILHEHQIYHKDIKIHNIMYDEKTDVLTLIDFDLSYAIPDFIVNYASISATMSSPEIAKVITKKPCNIFGNDLIRVFEVWSVALTCFCIFNTKYQWEMYLLMEKPKRKLFIECMSTFTQNFDMSIDSDDPRASLMTDILRLGMDNKWENRITLEEMNSLLTGV